MPPLDLHSIHLLTACLKKNNTSFSILFVLYLLFTVFFYYTINKKQKRSQTLASSILFVFYLFSFYIVYYLLQWGKKVFSQPPIVQVLPLKKMREACNFHHRYTSTMRDKIRKENPENHIVGFLKNLFANYGGK